MATIPGIDYQYLRQIVFGRTRNVLDPGSDYLFDTRLIRVLRNQGMSHLGELVQSLRTRSNPNLEKDVAEAMTINETSFFRDTRPFELLRTDLLPKLIEARGRQRSLRFWSGACSTGQEGYSLAMLLRESFPQLANWQIRIEGTDISAAVVERAQTGRYHRLEINRGLPARHVLRYFDHLNEEWTVKPEVRALCNFRQANLCTVPLPFSERFDVIFLRNVMLYFAQDTRRALMIEIHKLLAPDGVLFLGSSEQPQDTTRWTPVLANGTCHFKPRQPA